MMVDDIPVPACHVAWPCAGGGPGVTPFLDATGLFACAARSAPGRAC
jgi:hypothetical protein